MTQSSVRMCFRVVREDGQPVCAGFQTLVCVSRETGQPVSPPEHIRRVFPLIRENLTEPGFSATLQVAAGQRAPLDFAPMTSVPEDPDAR